MADRYIDANTNNLIKAPTMASHPDTIELSAQQRHRGMKLAVLFAIVGTFGNTSVSPSVLSLVAIKLGAGELYLGLLSFAAWAPLIMGMLTMSAIEHRGKKKVMLFWYCFSSVTVLPLLFLPQLANHYSTIICLAIVLGVISCKVTFDALALTGWFPILQDIVPHEMTGRFFARIRFAWQTWTAIILVATACFLSTDSQWWKFQVVFAVALVAFTLRIFALMPLTEKPPLKTKQNKTKLTAITADFFRNPSFRPFLTYLITYAFAFGIAEPFKIMGRPEDMLVAVSSSGQSPNILNVTRVALDSGCDVVTLSGFKADNPLRQMGRVR